MARRDSDNEATDEVLPEQEELTVGERLRAAREKKKLSLEDIAAQTRIPRRHLESLENSEWDSLPAPTYTTGFAKAYASSVGLDRTDIGDQLRAEMGGQRFTANTAEVFEAADPRRTMPKWLVIATVVAVIVLVALMSWLNHRSLEEPDQQPAQTQSAPAPAPGPAAAPARQAPAAAPNGPVVLTATAPAWIQVTDQGKTLYEAEMQPGQTYTVPATAAAPQLKAGKPEALKIDVGSAVAPPVGPAGKVASHVSLKPPDLMRGPAQAGAAPAPTTNTAAQ